MQKIPDKVTKRKNENTQNTARTAVQEFWMHKPNEMSISKHTNPRRFPERILLHMEYMYLRIGSTYSRLRRNILTCLTISYVSM